MTEREIDILNESANEENDNVENVQAHTFHRINHICTSKYIYGYSPAEIRRAYNFSRFYIGLGQTIAIISAYNAPTIRHDLDVFSRQFCLPEADLKVIYARGTVPPTNPRWAAESTLDVEWVHAMAPGAKILLVLAESNDFDDLFQAIDIASPIANVVSMSWGATEFPEETTFDRHMAHLGTVYVASAGDVGTETSYPAVSRRVLAVGGTTLKLDKCGNRLAPERVWVDTGGGPSAFVRIPPWQKIFKDVRVKSGAHRGTPDVAFLADPTPGVAVYNTTPYEGIVGWTTAGGTSLSAPCWAGLIACMAQGYGRFYNFSEFLYRIAGRTHYSKPQRYFNDIIIGRSDRTDGFPATEGWDFCTGLGTPKAGSLIARVHSF